MRPNQAALVLASAFFCLYAVHRLRYVGDCDSFAYYAQAQLFLGRDPGLEIFPNPLRHPALTPLGMDVARGHFVSAFPPGYSILMAFAGLLYPGGEYWVNPLLGAVSVGLIYVVVARETWSSIAWAAALLWGVCPLVAFNAADVMSDMLATVAALGSYLLLRTRRVAAGGVVAGLMMMIRPMNVLFLPCAALLVPRRIRPWIEFGASFAAGAAVSAAVEWHLWGALLSPTYRGNTGAFQIRYFLAQFLPYARETALHLGPMLALALLEGFRAPRRSAPELVWLGAFLLAYPFAGPVDIDWTRPRFLLPSYPAVFILAARALTDLLDAAQAASPRGLRRGSIAALALSLAWGAFCVMRATRIGATALSDPQDPNIDRVARAVPRTALVGTWDYTGALRLYAGIETFNWMQLDALGFARAEHAAGRSVYMLLEPDEMVADDARILLHRFSSGFALEPVVRNLERGYLLAKVVESHPPGRTRLALSNPTAQWALLDGWLDARASADAGYRTVGCAQATVDVLLKRGAPHEVDVVAANAGDGPARTMEARLLGRSIGRSLLGSEFSTSTFRVPKELSRVRAPLELHFPGAPDCVAKERLPVAFVRAIETRALSD